MVKKLIGNDQAQVVVEYILILFICVTLAVFLSRQLISRDPSNPGKMMSAWNKVLQIIGNDLPDCPGQNDFSKPNCR